MGRFTILVVLAFWLAMPPGRATDLHGTGGLAGYVENGDPSFEWRELRTGTIGSASYVELLMTSQTWRGHPWKHQLYVLRPANMKRRSRQALLFIHGGRWKDEYATAERAVELPREAQLFARLARSIEAPVAILRQVPFQPMFDRREDALIAFTFDQYLETGESDWPLLLPMVKSAVRAMDVVQEVARERWNTTIEEFTVTGASKRGWTSWLTAAVDRRVMGVAPMVIDVLNMEAQMDHQRATWGSLSEEIHDYSDLDLHRRLDSDRGRELLDIVDPYSYRLRLTGPKLVLLSTNDRYWPLDALNLYWPGLPDDKHVLYVPNQGHGLRDYDRVIASLSALHRYSARGKPLPDLTWEFAQTSRELRIEVEADRSVRDIVVWSASSPTRDFRSARWTARGCTRFVGRYVCRVPRLHRANAAAYAEVRFQDSGEDAFSLSTTVCIVAPADGEDARQSPDCNHSSS
ncbi:MAG: PhoPQ-activated pathogenicity-related family protein [Gemmatimonadetes bacterium]|nr:PhoPQ-activated pathogenicity-related family protein [Gemmatimonadota bacterium]